MADKDEDLLKGAEQLLNRSRLLSQRVATHNQRIVGEGDALAEEIKSLQKTLGEQHHEATVRGDAGSAALDAVRAAQAVVEGHGPGGDLRKLLKQSNPALLRMLLGARTNVVTLQRIQSIRLKEEYHAFRDRCGLVMFLGSALLLLGLVRAERLSQVGAPLTLAPPFMVGVQALLCYMLYTYTAMALRENVLKVNGSNIRTWWIHHHYWSIATCLLMLTLPVDSPAVQVTVKNFLLWSCLQGSVMMVQNRYQRRRMYTRIALGKNSAMDVVSGESSGGYGQLWLLYPLIFGLQALQFGIGWGMVRLTWRSLALSLEGYLDMERHESDLRGSRGVCVAGALMVFMAVCNFRNTVATVLEKRATRGRARKRLPGAASGAQLAAKTE